MIIGYARVSSAEQSYTQALAQQTQRLVDYGADEILTDIESGRSDGRKSFTQLLKIIQSQPANSGLVVVATRVDRLSRSIITTQQIYDLCDRYGVNLVTLDDHFDVSTASGKTQRDITAVFAAAESYRMSERITFGHAYHRQRGAAYFPIFGYEKVGDSLQPSRKPFLFCDGKEWTLFDIARYRIDLFLQLGSIRKVITTYNQKFNLSARPPSSPRNSSEKITFSNAGFITWVTNPILRGHTAYGRTGKTAIKFRDDWELVLNTHEPMMTDYEYQTIEEIILSNSKKNGSSFSSTRPFSGLVRCVSCNFSCCCGSFKLRSDKSIKKYYYQCASYRNSRTCDKSVTIREDKITDIVIQRLVEYSNQIFTLESADDLISDDQINNLQAQLSDLAKIPNPSNPILNAIKEINLQIKQRSLRLQLIKNTEAEKKDELILSLSDPSFWVYMQAKLSPIEIRSYFRKWISSIWIDNGEVVNIEFKF